MAAPTIDIPPALANDPEVYTAIKEFVLDVITEAREILKTSSPAIQLQLIRSVLPIAARSLATKSSDDGMDAMREEVKEMYDAFRVAVGIEDDEDVTTPDEA